MSASRIISLFSSPAPSAKRIPVSETKATSHLRSSSIKRHWFWTLRMSSIGMGSRLLTPADLSKYIPTKGFLRSSAYSEMAKLKTALMELITLPNARANQTLSNQMIPITQCICSGVLSQGLGSTGIYQISTGSLSSGFEGLWLTSTLLRDIGF